MPEVAASVVEMVEVAETVAAELTAEEAAPLVRYKSIADEPPQYCSELPVQGMEHLE